MASSQFPTLNNAITAGRATIAVGAGGAGGGGYNYTINNPNSMAGSMAVQGDLHLTGANADIKVNTKSMKDWMESVERRLLILEPKPELLAKHEALRHAYEHYKTLEAILYDEKE
jgi:hypothetical protein